MSIGLIFLIIALVLFVIAAFNVPVPRGNLVAAGLASWVIAELLGHFFK
jgi:hypothetical protein